MYECEFTIRITHKKTRQQTTTNKGNPMTSTRLKKLGLKGPVLKLGVEKFGVEMSFNRMNYMSDCLKSLINKNGLQKLFFPIVLTLQSFTPAELKLSLLSYHIT